MILSGDILWDRFRVMRVESERLRGAWLAPLNAAPASPSGRATHLLLPLEPPGLSPLAQLLAAVRRGARTAHRESAANPASEGRVKLPVFGDVEWRGSAESGGVALLEALPAAPLDAPRKELDT